MKKVKRTREQITAWLLAAQQRQQDWQQEVKQRWAERQAETSIAL